MLKRTIKYTNFHDEEKEGIFYFNLSKEEILFMALGEDGTDIVKHFQSLMEKEDNASILRQLRELILRAYGLRSEDGELFEKSDEIRDKFQQSAAYQALFEQILVEPEALLDFFIGTLPKDMQTDARAVTEKSTMDAYKNTPPVPPVPPTS